MGYYLVVILTCFLGIGENVGESGWGKRLGFYPMVLMEIPREIW
jgi:hypothetical protein